MVNTKEEKEKEKDQEDERTTHAPFENVLKDIHPL